MTRYVTRLRHKLLDKMHRSSRVWDWIAVQ